MRCLTGLPFCALLHSFRPGLFDYEELYRRNSEYELLETAVDSCRRLGIHVSLRVEDVTDVETPDAAKVRAFAQAVRSHFGGDEQPAQVPASPVSASAPAAASTVSTAATSTAGAPSMPSVAVPLKTPVTRQPSSGGRSAFTTHAPAPRWTGSTGSPSASSGGSSSDSTKRLSGSYAPISTPEPAKKTSVLARYPQAAAASSSPVPTSGKSSPASKPSTTPINRTRAAPAATSSQPSAASPASELASGTRVSFRPQAGAVAAAKSAFLTQASSTAPASSPAQSGGSSPFGVQLRKVGLPTPPRPGSTSAPGSSSVPSESTTRDVPRSGPPVAQLRQTFSNASPAAAPQLRPKPAASVPKKVAAPVSAPATEGEWPLPTGDGTEQPGIPVPVLQKLKEVAPPPQESAESDAEPPGKLDSAAWPPPSDAEVAAHELAAKRASQALEIIQQSSADDSADSSELSSLPTELPSQSRAKWLPKKETALSVVPEAQVAKPVEVNPGKLHRVWPPPPGSRPVSVPPAQPAPTIAAAQVHSPVKTECDVVQADVADVAEVHTAAVEATTAEHVHETEVASEAASHEVVTESETVHDVVSTPEAVSVEVAGQVEDQAKYQASDDAEEQPVQPEEQHEEQPTQHEEQPVQHAEQPEEQEKQPAHHEEEPVQHEEQPAHHEEQHEEQPTHHEEQPEEQKEQSAQPEEHSVHHEEPAQHEEHSVQQEEQTAQPEEQPEEQHEEQSVQHVDHAIEATQPEEPDVETEDLQSAHQETSAVAATQHIAQQEMNVEEVTEAPQTAHDADAIDAVPDMEVDDGDAENVADDQATATEDTTEAVSDVDIAVGADAVAETSVEQPAVDLQPENSEAQPVPEVVIASPTVAAVAPQRESLVDVPVPTLTEGGAVGAGFRAVRLQLDPHGGVHVTATAERDGDSWKADFDQIAGMAEPSMPAFIFANVHDDAWLLLLWQPDTGVTVRDRMLYTSNAQRVREFFGDDRIVDTLQVTCSDEMTVAHYEHMREGDKTASMSEAEQIKSNARQQEELARVEMAQRAVSSSQRGSAPQLGVLLGGLGLSKRASVTPKSIDASAVSDMSIAGPNTGQALGGYHAVTLPLSERATEAVASFRNGETNWLELLVSDDGGSVDCASTALLEADAVTAAVNVAETRFYVYSLSVDGGESVAVFLYVCPGSSKVKQRMVYSTSKPGVIESLAAQGISIRAKVHCTRRRETTLLTDTALQFESSDAADVTHAWLEGETREVLQSGSQRRSAAEYVTRALWVVMCDVTHARVLCVQDRCCWERGWRIR
jgi:hypothetical protein